MTADKEHAKLVKEYPWTRQRATVWWTPDQLSFSGSCAWNHSKDNLAPASRIVVTELAGEQDAWACCDECYESVLRYVGATGD